MKLYDSYGKIVDIKPSELKIYTSESKEWIEQIRNDINACVAETPEGHKGIWSFKLDNNRLIMYAENTFIDEESMRTRVAGIVFSYNPADGQLCRMSHFSTSRENFDNNILGFMASTNTFPKYLRQSLEEEAVFPEIQTIMEQLSEKYDLENKDGYAYNKNMYILTTEIPLDKKASGMVWNTFNELKKVPGVSGARYNGNEITWTNEEKEKVRGIISPGRISCNGNIYDSIDEFIDELKSDKCRLNKDEYGKDKAFLGYLESGKLEEMEQEEELDR